MSANEQNSTTTVNKDGDVRTCVNGLRRGGRSHVLKRDRGGWWFGETPVRAGGGYHGCCVPRA